MGHVYIIEGLPGSGKTTFSKRLEMRLKGHHQSVIRLNEGDLHPIDLAWCSITDQQTFEDLCERYVDVKDQILDMSKKYQEKVVTAYTKIKVPRHYTDFYDVFETFEIYRTNDLNQFKREHLELWDHFSKSYDQASTYVFECIFLQNHINELILTHNVNFDEMVRYFKDLLEAIHPIKPVVIYINQRDVESRINFVAKERVTDDPSLYRDWFDLVKAYIEKSRYGQTLGFTGNHGAMTYFKTRKALELKILETLDCDIRIIDLDDDYDQAFDQLVEGLKDDGYDV